MQQGLLKDLERFAFQGCGRPMSYDTAASGENVSQHCMYVCVGALRPSLGVH